MTVDRYRPLAAKQAVSQQDLDNAEAGLREAAAADRLGEGHGGGGSSSIWATAASPPRWREWPALAQVRVGQPRRPGRAHAA